MTREDIERYLRARSAENGDCWVWLRACTSYGHPVASINGRRSITVRRWAWEQLNAKRAGALCVTNTCQNMRCVNPDHILAVTPGDRNRLMWASGRMHTAEAMAARKRNARANSPLTEQDVVEIRRRRANGETLRSIAADYPVQERTVASICRWQSWADLASNPYLQLIR